MFKKISTGKVIEKPRTLKEMQEVKKESEVEDKKKVK